MFKVGDFNFTKKDLNNIGHIIYLVEQSDFSKSQLEQIVSAHLVLFHKDDMKKAAAHLKLLNDRKKDMRQGV